MGATRIPSESLWRERLPVLGYVGVKSGQSSSFGPQTPHPLYTVYLQYTSFTSKAGTEMVTTTKDVKLMNSEIYHIKIQKHCMKLPHLDSVTNVVLC